MTASLATLARLAKLLGFDQHIIWISIAFLPLLAQPSKPCPVILFAAVHSFDKLKVDASPRLLNHHLEFLREFQVMVKLTQARVSSTITWNSRRNSGRKNGSR